MKQILLRAILLLSNLIGVNCIGYAQTHYIKANSLAGIEVKEGGGVSSICPTYISHLSTANNNDQFFFAPTTCLADYLKFEIINPTTSIVKITLTTTYGGAVNTWTLAPNGGRTGVQLIPWSMTYNWKFEQTTATVQMIADTVKVDSGYGAIVQAGTNDIVLPAGTAFRVKAGQTLNLGSISQMANQAELFFSSNNQIGSQSIVLEGYNPTTNAIVGESNLTIIVNAPCSFSILSAIQQSLGSQLYDVKLTSNRTTKPYMYRVFNSAGNVVKQGNTSSATFGDTEIIDVGDIPTGIYTIKFYSTFAANCGEPTKQISHVNVSDVCSLQATATRSNNNFAVSLPTISGVTNYDYTLTNPQDSAIASGVTSGSTLNLNFANKIDGEYYLYLKPNSSTKVCSQRLKLVWLATNSTISRGYLKRYNNVIDYFEIAGAGDYGGAKDGGTGWVIKETKTAIAFRTYVKNLSNVAGAKAILTLREDSSSVSKHVSIAIEKDRIKVSVRTARNANNVVIADILGKTTPRWIQIRRNGNSAIIEESDSPADANNPIFTNIKSITNAFLGWKNPYYKGLYVTSASNANLASAEFHRFLGGPYTGTDAAVDNSPLTAPVLVSSSSNATVNSNVTLTITGCKSGFLPVLYKNSLSNYSGASTSVVVSYNDTYKARCESGSTVSAFSNNITFISPSVNQICGISDGLKLGTKTVGTTTYDIYARIFNGKLWVTQSLNTTPESFLVRAVNFLSITFQKTWSGSNYSCFEGQTSGFGGVVEPNGFVTPPNYTLSTTADGAKIYTLGSSPVVNGGGNSGNTLSGVVFPNMFSSIAIETSNDTFSPEKFKNLTYPTGLVKGSFPKHYDADLGLNVPNWINVLHTDLALIYKNKGLSLTDDFGFLGSVDVRQHWTQNVHWALFPWGNFTTALPVEKRVEAYNGTMVEDFLQLNDAGVIARADQIAFSTDFGNIISNGKTQRMFTNIDAEGAGEDGSAGIRKPLLMLKRISQKTTGIFAYMYATVIRSDLGYRTNNEGYPDENGNIPYDDINPIFRDSEIIDGQAFKAFDYKNLAPMGEISHYGESAGGNYNDGVRQLTVFGQNANNEHYLGRVVEHVEKNYYAMQKLSGGRDLLLWMPKMICDRGGTGWQYNDGNKPTGGGKTILSGYLKRDQVFKQWMATFFSGAHVEEWNRPITGLNTDAMNGMEMARTVLNTEVIFSPTEKVSALSLRNTGFEFSLWNGEYKLDGESNWRKEKGFQLRDTQDNLLVRFMRKGNYIVVFVADPYNLATKKNNLQVRWGSFTKTFNLSDWASCYPDGSTKDYIFAIYNVSGATNSTGAVNAPTINSNPTIPVAASPVTFTASNCTGIVKWFISDAQVGTGASLTVSNPFANSSYVATCTVGSNTSIASNAIFITSISNLPISGTVTITQPNRAANYYKSSTGNPQIILNYQYSTNDVVYLSNSQIKVGFNLRYGGAICYLSQINSTVNLVNNGYDGGRQIQPDYYQNPENYTQNGKVQVGLWAANGYNTTLGGDYNKNTVTLIDYYPVENGYYLKFRPLLWSFDAELSQTMIEVRYTLDGNAVKCEYKYTSSRTDNQIPSGLQIKGWAIPVAYMNEDFTQLHTYTGNAPFTNGALSVITIPSNIAPAMVVTQNGEANSKEYWAAMVNPTTNIAVGFYNKMPGKSDTYFQFKRENISAGSVNTEFADAFSLIQIVDSYQHPDSHSEWSRNDTAYIVVGNVSDVRTKIYEINNR